MALSVRDLGKGHPLVFLHGFCETSDIWEEFVKPLTKDYRVITPDLPGFGNSSSLESPFTIDQVADVIAAWLKEKSIGPSAVVGHSLGGYVGLSLAERHRELLKGLVLFNSTAYPDTEEKKINRDRIIAFVKQHGVAPYVDTFVPGLFFDTSIPSVKQVFSIANRTTVETLTGYAAAMKERPGRLSILEDADLPKLIIAGKNDSAVTIEISREMAKISKNCAYLELDKSAHMGLFEASGMTRAAITSFTDQIFS